MWLNSPPNITRSVNVFVLAIIYNNNLNWFYGNRRILGTKILQMKIWSGLKMWKHKCIPYDSDDNPFSQWKEILRGIECLIYEQQRRQSWWKLCSKLPAIFLHLKRLCCGPEYAYFIWLLEMYFFWNVSHELCNT